MEYPPPSVPSLSLMIHGPLQLIPVPNVPSKWGEDWFLSTSETQEEEDRQTLSTLAATLDIYPGVHGSDDLAQQQQPPSPPDASPSSGDRQLSVRPFSPSSSSSDADSGVPSAYAASFLPPPPPRPRLGVLSITHGDLHRAATSKTSQCVKLHLPSPEDAKVGACIIRVTYQGSEAPPPPLRYLRRHVSLGFGAAPQKQPQQPQKLQKQPKPLQILVLSSVFALGALPALRDFLVSATSGTCAFSSPASGPVPFSLPAAALARVCGLDTFYPRQEHPVIYASIVCLLPTVAMLHFNILRKGADSSFYTRRNSPAILFKVLFNVLLSLFIGLFRPLFSPPPPPKPVSSNSAPLQGYAVELVAFVPTDSYLRQHRSRPVAGDAAVAVGGLDVPVPSCCANVVSFQAKFQALDEADKLLLARGDVSQRFVDGMEGDLREACERWRATKAWREEQGMDGILMEPTPHFSTIKKHYPHYYCARGKSGSIVYYEYCGRINVPALKREGASIEMLVRHYLYMSEFCFSSLMTNDLQRTITVFDVDNVKVSELQGDVLTFIKRTTAIMQAHYPERSEVILIVNAPRWFTLIWSIVKPMVNERTQKKVRIMSRAKTLEGLSEFIEPANIPNRYGGQLRFTPTFASEEEKKGFDDDDCRWFCEEEVRFREHVFSQKCNRPTA